MFGAATSEPEIFLLLVTYSHNIVLPSLFFSKLLKYMNQDEPEVQKHQKLEEDHLNEEELMAVLDQGDQYEDFDDVYLKKIIHSLEQIINQNQDLRLKYQDYPEKYVDSEVDLDEQVRKFLALTAYPDYFPLFYQSSALENMIQLLQHPNDDIRIEVLNFFKELVSADVTDENVKTLLHLYDTLVKKLFFQALVDVLENNDSLDIQVTVLIILETMVEIKSQYNRVLCESTKIMRFLLKQLDLGDNDVVLHSSEFLVDLIQGSPENQHALVKQDGINRLLEILAQFRKKDAGSAAEKEIVANLFDILNILLLSTDYQEEFTKLEGIQLLLKLVQAKNYCSQPAFKVLRGAIEAHHKNCEVFVQWNGLSLLFPILISKGLKNKNPQGQKEIDECALGILKNLLRHLTGVNLDRLVTKFEQPLYVQRIVQLREYYRSKIKRKKQNNLIPEQLEENYLQELEKGLALVESCDIILLELLKKNNPVIDNEIKQDLEADQLSKENIVENIQNMLTFFNSQAKVLNIIQQLQDDYNHYTELTL